ncbi:MAG TPA: sigma-70 family RNA polymerase sigma factor, partial [Gemmataceae bacterium]|nr:sigma-70 family RNA polymerase sigma factor [Gemmataceae bacterium]
MGDSRSGRVLWHLHHWLGSTATPADDARLLERFVRQRDEDAFAELVSRHCPLVFGLCRRLLGNVQDAEDVFQATFLVLARKAATIRKPESLSCWLHGVAYRLALKAKTEANKRRIHEHQVPPLRETEAVELSWREVRGLLDEELQRLPEKQRLPLMLCYLEGLTQDEASRRLGWPRDTLKRRLEAGRERLRVCLTQRGVTFGAGLFAAALTDSATKGAVSTTLGNTTVQASIQFVTNETAALAATPAALLAKGALQTMFMTKLKIASVVVLLLACAGFGASQLAQRRSSPQTAAANKEADRPKASADNANVVDEVEAELRKMRGTWATTTTKNSFVNGEPQPPKEITVKFVIKEDKIIQLGEDGFIDEKWTIRLDPSQKPKAIDLTSRLFGTSWGIYQLEGDSLKIRYSDKVGKRPTEFSSKTESEWALWNLKRTSRTPAKAVARFPNAPGCYWVVEPTVPPACMATLGTVFIYEKDRDGAAFITLAAALPGRRHPEYRPVLLDAKGKRYLPTNSTGGGFSERRGN